MIFSTQAVTTLLFGGSLLVAGCGVHGLDDTDAADRNQELVREQLERRLEGVFAANAAKEEEQPPSRHNLLRSEPSHRDLGGGNNKNSIGLFTDYGVFKGEWYDCLHTKLMTMNGTPAEKHTINSVECDGGLFGTVTSLDLDGIATQTLQMEIMLLNHCFFHGMGDTDKGFSKPCPHDRIDSDSRGDGNVKVIYRMVGIGSFAGTGKSIEFVSDHTYVHDPDGDMDMFGTGEMYSMSKTRATLENPDTMTCTVKGLEGGIVCDWRINEVRQGRKAHAGCLKIKNAGDDNEERICERTCKKGWDEAKCAKKSWSETKCAKKAFDEVDCAEEGGTWAEGACDKGYNWDVACEMEHIENGFGYESFGSYYLVHDRTKCTMESSPTGEYCPNANDRPDPIDNCTEGEDCTTAPTVSPAPTSTPVPVWGCYRGGRCGSGVHGCCDCGITSAEECAASGFTDGVAWTAAPIWTGGCGSICRDFD